MPPELDIVQEEFPTPNYTYNKISIKDLIVKIKEESQETIDIIASIRNYLKTIVYIDKDDDCISYDTIDEISKIEDAGVLFKDLLAIQEYNRINMVLLSKIKTILTKNFGEDVLPF